MSDDLPAVELVEPDDSSPTQDGRPEDTFHRSVRSVAAVVAALAMLWIAWSVAGLRSDSREQRCIAIVDNHRWALESVAYEEQEVGTSGRPILDDDLLEELLEDARACSADYAETLELQYSPASDEP